MVVTATLIFLKLHSIYLHINYFLKDTFYIKQEWQSKTQYTKYTQDKLCCFFEFIKYNK